MRERKEKRSDIVGIGKMIQRNQYMSGICECHNHNEMMGQPLRFSFCCLFVHLYVYVCVFDHTPECVLCQCRQ